METVMKICEVHGLTEYYAYKGIANKCIICAKKKAIEWRNSSDENMRKHLKSVERWRIQNPERCDEWNEKYNVINSIKRKKTTKEITDNFYSRFGDFINSMSKKLELKKIPKRIHLIEEPDEYKIFQSLINSKEKEILIKERGRLSTLYTWRVLKSHTSKGATEEQLKEIEKYKDEALKITEIKMEKILKSII